MCWKLTYGRGGGVPISVCGPNEERGAGGGICYPHCRTGWIGNADRCLGPCPEGYVLVGDPGDARVCHRAAKTLPRLFLKGEVMLLPCTTGDYHVGTCYRDRCPQGTVRQGPVCKLESCPAGYVATVAECIVPMDTMERPWESRGAGTPLKCSQDLQLSGALCYPKCSPGYAGVGPVCWMGCTGAYGVECGAGCATDAAACTNSIMKMITAPIEVISKIADALFTAGTGAAASSVKFFVIELQQRLAQEMLTNAVKDTIKATMSVQANAIASAVVGAERMQGFDWYSLDPTGIANVVKAFNYPTCSPAVPPPQ